MLCHELRYDAAPFVAGSLDPAGTPVVPVEVHDRQPAALAEYPSEGALARPAAPDHQNPPYRHRTILPVALTTSGLSSPVQKRLLVQRFWYKPSGRRRGIGCRSRLGAGGAGVDCRAGAA
jgi:hypothetical protein